MRLDHLLSKEQTPWGNAPYRENPLLPRYAASKAQTPEGRFFGSVLRRFHVTAGRYVWSVIQEEIDLASPSRLEAYLQGALKDGTRSRRHGTHRIGQADRRWVEFLQEMLRRLGYSAWVYQEGKSREYWIVETTAPFLSTTYDASALIGIVEGLYYARGYFDAEGGLPRGRGARLYVQLVQKNRASLEILTAILEAAGITCGRLHVPSIRADPDLWRFYVRASSQRRFMEVVSSWHPRKRDLIEERLSRTSVTIRTSRPLLRT